MYVGFISCIFAYNSVLWWLYGGNVAVLAMSCCSFFRWARANGETEWIHSLWRQSEWIHSLFSRPRAVSKDSIDIASIFFFQVRMDPFSSHSFSSCFMIWCSVALPRVGYKRSRAWRVPGQKSKIDSHRVIYYGWDEVQVRLKRFCCNSARWIWCTLAWATGGATRSRRERRNQRRKHENWMVPFIETSNSSHLLVLVFVWKYFFV